MKIIIHRGTNQIGGCVTEIESGGYKVFIDFGEQLPGTLKKELPYIEGLTCGDISKSSLFITHYHGDHIGKICDTVPGLPIYMGETALEIYRCLENKLSYIPDPIEAYKHKKNVERIKSITTFKIKETINIGNISVIPYFVDHSAFDAYMFVIEADNKRILHLGDFRGHGFRSKGLIPTLKRYIQDIDYIISEGTNIQRPDVTNKTEQELQKDFELYFKENKYNFILLSSTNIDRIFSLYHAAKSANRCFVCDSYQTEILKTVSEKNKKFTTFYDIDYSQTKDSAGRFFELKPQGCNPYLFKGKLEPYLEKNGFCMLIRSNERFKYLLDKYAQTDVAKIYYSMWTGYLDSRKLSYNESLSSFLKPYKIEYIHTSGYTDIEMLKAVFETVKPKCGVIPIHTDAPEVFKELFDKQINVLLLQDGDILECNL